MKRKSKILYMIFLAGLSFCLNCQERIEIKKWYTGDGQPYIRETTHYDESDNKTLSISINNGQIVGGYLYSYKDNKCYMYDLDGELSIVTEYFDKKVITTYYNDGNPDYRTVSTDISDNTYRFINYELPEESINEAFERTTRDNGTALIKWLSSETLEVISEEEDIPFGSTYTYKHQKDSEDRIIREIALEKDRVVYVKEITYIE